MLFWPCPSDSSDEYDDDCCCSGNCEAARDACRIGAAAGEQRNAQRCICGTQVSISHTISLKTISCYIIISHTAIAGVGVGAGAGAGVAVPLEGAGEAVRRPATGAVPTVETTTTSFAMRATSVARPDQGKSIALNPNIALAWIVASVWLSRRVARRNSRELLLAAAK
eukprot:SAG31_NODE_10664_length_1112_cov_1.331688_1_plen_168_part_00